MCFNPLKACVHNRLTRSGQARDCIQCLTTNNNTPWAAKQLEMAFMSHLINLVSWVIWDYNMGNCKGGIRTIEFWGLLSWMECWIKKLKRHIDLFFPPCLFYEPRTVPNYECSAGCDFARFVLRNNIVKFCVFSYYLAITSNMFLEMYFAYKINGRVNGFLGMP